MANNPQRDQPLSLKAISAIIPQEERRTYLQVLAGYQLEVGQLNNVSGVWPQPALLSEFSDFCQRCYQHTQQLLEKSFAILAKREV